MNNCRILVKYLCGTKMKQCGWFTASPDDPEVCDWRNPDNGCECWSCQNDAEEKVK